jgi:hypothetical protein
MVLGGELQALRQLFDLEVLFGGHDVFLRVANCGEYGSITTVCDIGHGAT